MPDIRRSRVSELKKAVKEDDRLARTVSNFFVAQETERGSQFIVAANVIYFYVGETHRLLRFGSHIRPNDEFLAFLTSKYGIVYSEKVTKSVLNWLDAHARRNGKRAEVHRFAHYDQNAGILYLSAYDGTVLRLDGQAIYRIPNGKEALFVDDDKGSPLPNETILVGPHGQLFDTLVNDLQFVPTGQLSVESQRTLLCAWILCLPFASLLPGPPILLLEGEKGSGKTVAIKRIQTAIMGQAAIRPLSRHDEKDFGVALLRSPIALLDNVDSFISWLPDAMAAYSTGASWSKRKLYSDDEEHEVKPNSWIVVTSRSPRSFRRDDVADRTILLRMDRRVTFGFEQQILPAITKNRATLYGEWLYYINNMIRALKLGNLTPVAHRLSDFTFVAKAAEVAAKLGPVDEALTQLQAEREEFTLEGDPLLDYLLHWMDNGANEGREVTAKDLLHELKGVNLFGEELRINTALGLGCKLRDKKSALNRHIEIVDAGKNRRGSKLYKFLRREDV